MQNLEKLKQAIQDLNPTVPMLVETKKEYQWTTFECGCSIIEVVDDKANVNICGKHSDTEFTKELPAENPLWEILKIMLIVFVLMTILNSCTVSKPNTPIKYLTVTNVQGICFNVKEGELYIYGIYHQVSPKHLQRYCEETSYRYNSRKLTDKDRFVNNLQRANGFRLTYNNLIQKSDKK